MHRVLIFLRQSHSVLLSHVLPLLHRTVELIEESSVSLLDLRIVRGGSWVVLDGGKGWLSELCHCGRGVRVLWRCSTGSKRGKERKRARPKLNHFEIC
jgi:hypothetical protein